MAFTATQVSVGTSAVPLGPSLESGRFTLVLSNAGTGTDIVYIGTGPGVSASTGFPIPPGQVLPVDVNNASGAAIQLYAVATAAATPVGFMTGA